MGTALKLPHISARLFGAPLLIHRPKLDAIVQGLGPRLTGEIQSFRLEEDDKDDRPREMRVRSRIASIPVLGSLVHRPMGMEALSGVDSTQDVMARIEAAIDDPEIDGILLEIDSPGGEVAGVFDLSDAIFAARDLKPIVAVANEMALSAGFAIASAAEKVFVPRTGVVGSVGVVAMHVDQSELNEKVGIKPTFVFAGEKKVDGNPHEPLSDSARAELQGEVDKIFSLFLETVSRNRGISTEDVRSTQAGVFSGKDAVDVGFADAVGGRARALKELKTLIADRREQMDLEQKIVELKTEHERILAENEDLRAKIDSFEQKAKDEREAGITTYLESIQAQSAEAQQPIEAAQIEEIRSLFALGQDRAARLVGDSLLKAAGAASAKPFARNQESTSEDERTKQRRASIQTQRRHLEHAGWDVELSADGLSIIKTSKKKR